MRGSPRRGLLLDAARRLEYDFAHIMRHELLAVLSVVGLLVTAPGCGPIASARWRYHCESPVPAGGVCLGADECQDGLRCVAGRCAPVAAAGASCAAPHDCAAGLACHQTYLASGTCMATTCSEAGRDTGNCVTTVSTGRPCAADLTCRPLEVCAVESTTISECRPIPARGEVCEGFLGWECASGLVCDLVSHTCEVPRAGGTCGISGEDVSQACGPSLGCDARTDGTNVCVARGAEGARCTTESCQAGLHCNFNTLLCDRDRTQGMSCSAGNECGVALGRRLDCVAGSCVATDVRGANCFPGRYGCGAGLRCQQDR